MVIVGSEMFERGDAAAIHAAVSAIAQKARIQSKPDEGEDWKVLNVLHRVKTKLVFFENYPFLHRSQCNNVASKLSWYSYVSR